MYIHIILCFSHYTKKELLFLVNLYYDIGDYDEAIKYLDELLTLNNYILNYKERNLFMIVSKAKFLELKNKVLRLNEKATFNNPNIVSTHINENILTNHLFRLESEIKEFSEKMVSSIEEIQDRQTTDDYNSKIFYLKLKADYLKYVLEVTDDEEDRTKIEYECQNNYQNAYELCNELEAHSPLVLSVVLNYSVFIYNVIDDTHLAIEIAESGYTNAIIKLNGRQIDEVSHILKMIETNVGIWKKETTVKK